jgi:threonine/homoserine/homoserine lactone efflux protein
LAIRLVCSRRGCEPLDECLGIVCFLRTVVARWWLSYSVLSIHHGYTSSVPHGSTLGVFVGSAIALLLTPGPAVLYIVTRSIEQGRVAGLVSVLGICTGTLVHVLAATLGLSALLVSSALAFAAVRYLGAAYLIILGLQTLTRGETVEATIAIRRAGLRRVFAQGVFVNVLNPHTALFFFAFLPQFIAPSSGHVPAQMLTLGLLFVGLSATTDSGWAIAAGTAGDWIKQHPRFTRGQRYMTGGALIGLGAAAALAGNGRK